MKNYAIIRISGNQYKVQKDDQILIDKYKSDKIIPEVLLYVSDNEVKVGKPVLKGVKVELEIIEKELKGKKISVQKYRAKSRYRRKLGFRPLYSKILIEKITS